jgi:hypothetical protein
MLSLTRTCVFVLSMALLPTTAAAQVSVTTWHNDLARTGANTHETQLTPANVNRNSFGKLCGYPVDGQIYAEPLYVPGLTIGGGKHDVTFVATEHVSVFALDANCKASRPLWQTSFLGPHIKPMPCTADRQPQCDVTIMSPEHGISPTPVIDEKRGVIYVAAQTVEAGVYTQKLHALSLASGAEEPGSPVVVKGRAPSNPKLQFDPEQAFQRAGLLLLNGVVYVPFASNDSANGWMFGYDAKTLRRVSVFSVTPHGSLGGIWGGGAAPAADDAGSIYAGTGNGTFDADRHMDDYGMSALRLVADGETLDVADYFTPTHAKTLSKKDLDLDSGGLILLPTQSGAHPHEAVIGFKTGELFLLDTDRMGHFGNAHAIQAFTANRGGIYSTAAWWNGNVYLAGVDGKLAQWHLRKGLFGDSPTHESLTTYNYPGATPAISANGNSDGIVWTIAQDGRVKGGRPAVLHADAADDVSKALYDSNEAGTRDRPGAGVKFTVPTIADGRVFIGTQTELDIYGELQ